MSLQSTVDDCQKVLNFLLYKDKNVFIDNRRNLKFADRTIIGLFKSLIENAKAFIVLEENQLENPGNIIIRTMIEQYTYFRYIFKINNRNDIIKKSKALSFYQRKEIESINKQIIEGYKKELKIKEKEEKQKEYIILNEEYKKLFKYNGITEKVIQKNKVNNRREKLANKEVYKYWYNLEKNKHNCFRSLKDLMEDLKIDPYVYIIYARLSDSTHGIADLKNIALKDANFLIDKNKSPNITIINHISDETMPRLIISLLSGVFSFIFYYYKQLSVIPSFKIMKVKMNSNADLAINYLNNILKNGFN